MRVGDQVTHDFSGGVGFVTFIDRASNYPYRVVWADGKADYYKADALKVVRRAKRSSTER